MNDSSLANTREVTHHHKHFILVYLKQICTFISLSYFYNTNKPENYFQRHKQGLPLRFTNVHNCNYQN